MSIANSFNRFAKLTSRAAGHPQTFGLALAVIAIWAVTGPIFHFSDTWQLFINTGTTIVTFLMVFLIQNTQNRDGAAMQLKLDELIRALKGARNELVDLEDMTDGELEEVKTTYTRRGEKPPTKPKPRREKGDDDQAEPGTPRGSEKAPTKASPASGSS